MNFVSIICRGLADWGLGDPEDRKIPLDASLGEFAGAAAIAVALALFIRPKGDTAMPKYP